MSEPVIRMSALRARDELGAIHGLELALPAGPVGALLGSPADGATALAKVLAGLVRPHGGALRIGGRDPGASPDLRRSLGVLLPEPVLPDVGPVRDLLTLVRGLRGAEAPRDTWYEPLDIASLASRKIRSLHAREARTVALALALAAPSPVALVLYDPLAVSGASADVLRPLLRARSDQGACVLLLTPSARDAAALADDVATLEQGRIGRAMGQPDVEQLVPGSAVELMVWCDLPRAFASSLVLEPEVTSLSWTASEGGGALRVCGPTAHGCARAIARVALEGGITVHAIQQVVPGAPEINAASAGLVLAMRHNAAYAATTMGGRS